MAIEFEWSIENVDIETGDIHDLDFADSLDEFYACDLFRAMKGMIDPEMPGTRLRLTLVKDFRSKSGNLLDRQWAYVIDGKLESSFRGAGDNEEGAKVPARFVRELRSHG